MRRLLLLFFVISITTQAQKPFTYQSDSFGLVTYTPFSYQVTSVYINGQNKTSKYNGYVFNYSVFEYLERDSTEYLIAFFERINDTVGNYIIEGIIESDQMLDHFVEENSTEVDWNPYDNKGGYDYGKVYYTFRKKGNKCYGTLEFFFNRKRYQIKGVRKLVKI